jgi:YggT family protein
VVSQSNDFVAAIWRAVNALLDPILQPIRRILPNTGMLDLSPLVLIIGLNILVIVLNNLAYSYA